MEPEFKAAVFEDLESLIALLANDELGHQREKPGLPIHANYLQAFTAINDDPNNLLLVVKLNKQTIGMLQLTFIPYLTHIGSWRCLIEGVRIDKAFRGKGIGEKMFAHAKELAKKKGCNMVQLTSDKQRPDAIRFYEKLGFRASHEGFKLQL